jgi:hypothetical protein
MTAPIFPSFSVASPIQTTALAEKVKTTANSITITDDIILRRLNSLASESKRRSFEYDATFEVPIKGKGKTSVSLKFQFNVDRFLTDCTDKLRSAGFEIADKIQFKGGALHFVLDGHPKDLHDFDVSLKIASPLNPKKDWQTIHEIILECMENEAGLIRYENTEDGFVVYQQKKSPFNIEMVIEKEEGTTPKRFLFQHPGTLKNIWCASETFRKMNEEYLLYQIPTKVHNRSCPIDVEIVASHKNSATCSLDALRIDYPLGEKETKAYFSAVDGYDVRHILELRERSLFDVQLERIPTIHLGFLRYNSILMKGYLPTSLVFEQAYGEHLSKSEMALNSIEKNLEKYINDHCATPEKQILYLLISHGTLSRLNIDNSVLNKLQVLYGQTLLKILNEKATVNELVEDASLFLSLYFESFSKELMYKERLLLHKYETRQLTRFFGSAGKRGSAFVFETTKFKNKEAVKEQLRKSLHCNPALMKICTLFLLEAEKIDRLLDIPTDNALNKRSESPVLLDFSSYLENAGTSSLHIKKQARQLQDLFSFKSESLGQLKDGQKEKLTKNIIEILQTLKDTAPSLSASLYTAASSHHILPKKEKENFFKILVEKLLTPGDFKEAISLCKLGIADSEISFGTLDSVFTILLESPINIKSVLMLLGEINFKKDNQKNLLQLWEKILEKICSQPATYAAIMTFWKMFEVFGNDCKEAGVLDQMLAGSSRIIEMTLKLLRESKDDQLLRWAYEVQKRVDSPCFETDNSLFLEAVKKECADLISKGIERPGHRMVPLYLHCQYDLINEDFSERFLEIFPAFVKAAFPCQNYEVCLSIIYGVNHFLKRNLSTDVAKDVFKILMKFSQSKSFPMSLRPSMESLGKYCHEKIESKFSMVGFHKSIEAFLLRGKDFDFEESISLFRILRNDTTDEVLLNTLHVDVLKLFEAALKKPEKSAKFISLLHHLAATINYQNWKEDQKAKYEICLGDLAKIPKLEQAAKSIDLDESEWVSQLEVLLKAKPEILKIWRDLYNYYERVEDHLNLIRIGKGYLSHIPHPIEKIKVVHGIAFSYLMLGDLEKAYFFLNKSTVIQSSSKYTTLNLFYAAMVNITLGRTKMELMHVLINAKKMVENLDDDVSKHRVCVYLLGFFEKAIQKPEKSKEDVIALQGISKFLEQEWKGSIQSERFKACKLQLSHINSTGSVEKKSDEKKSKLILETISKLEDELKKNPNAVNWRKLYEIYVTLEDHANIVRTGHGYLQLLNISQREPKLIYNIAYSHLLNGEPGKTCDLLNNFLSHTKKPTGLAYFYLASAGMIHTKVVIDLNDPIDCFHTIIKEDDVDKHRCYVYMLGVFEVALGVQGKSPENIEKLHVMAKLLRYKGWNESQKARYGTCLLALNKLNKSKIDVMD